MLNPTWRQDPNENDIEHTIPENKKECGFAVDDDERCDTGTFEYKTNEVENENNCSETKSIVLKEILK